MGAGSIHRREFFVLGAILVLAIVLRIVGLNAALWFDEIVSLETHLRLPWSERMRSYSMNHHYLYFESKVVIEIFGASPWSLRLPALIFGVASIGACWVLARHVAGPTIAHISALLLALSYHHIWFSQNARGYTELSFWALLGMILFLKGIAAPGPKIWIIYGVTLALAVFTHLTGAFFFAAQSLVWLAVLAWRAMRGSLTRDLLAGLRLAT